MVPAIVWEAANDHSGAGRSVEERLRARAGITRASAAEARRRFENRRPSRPVHGLTRAGGSGPLDESYYFPRGRPSNSVAVFVFALPDSAPAKELLKRKAYFDVRTGDTWDVFFPGYFQYGSMLDPNQIKFDDFWGFSPRAFDDFRRDLELRTDRRWTYSGGSDLVLLNLITFPTGDVEIDFKSVQSGSLTDPNDDSRTLTLARVIELISVDLEEDRGDESYGVSAVVNPALAEALRRHDEERRAGLRETAVAASGAILGAIGSHFLGLG